ncbi:hypothetical protein BaRGS_00033718 [Batillaria attramentaria]|uniref:Max-binding protein MNT n=1 Tax=Batillaria attramentaria TaxID=370345 RepID=A0ABD0JKP0_9CAEN
MSLETLLEAAQWVESSSKEKTREDSSRQFHHYAKSPSISEDNSDGRADDTREKRRTGGAGTREVHNKLEKNRRAHLKECFDVLKKQIPQLEEKKTSNLGILRGSLKLIQTLKRKERENELELQRLAQEKSRLRHRFERLHNELDQLNVKVDHFMQAPDQDQESNSTSTATEGPETPPGSDEEQEPPTPTVQQPVAKAIPHPVIRTVSSVTPAIVTGRRPSASSVPQSPGPQMTPLNLVMTTSPNAGASNAVVQPSPVVVRPPVTQLLQQTLEKRQAQSKQQQSGVSQVNTVMSSQAMRQVVKAIPATMPGVVSFPSMVSLVSAAGGGAKPGGVALPANQAKALGQSLLLTPSSAHNLATAPNHTATTPTVLQAPMGLGGATVITPIRATPNTAAVSTSSTTGLTTTSNPLSRPLLTAAVQGAAVTAPQVLATGPLAAFGHHQLLTQLQRGTSMSGMGMGVGGLPMVSLGAAGAQLVSPLTVMTPNLGMLGTPLLKQFPLLQQHPLLTNAQVLHTAQQQQPQQSVVNPLVVMSMPSVVTTTTTATPAVATGTKVTS